MVIHKQQYVKYKEYVLAQNRTSDESGEMTIGKQHYLQHSSPQQVHILHDREKMSQKIMKKNILYEQQIQKIRMNYLQKKSQEVLIHQKETINDTTYISSLTNRERQDVVVYNGYK